MLRHALLAVGLVFCLGTGAGCIVHHPHHGAPKAKRCATKCASHGHRRVCKRRCRVWRNGVCVSYRQHCKKTRYCKRHVTRCR